MVSVQTKQDVWSSGGEVQGWGSGLAGRLAWIPGRHAELACDWTRTGFWQPVWSKRTRRAELVQGVLPHSQSDRTLLGCPYLTLSRNACGGVVVLFESPFLVACWLAAWSLALGRESFVSEIGCGEKREEGEKKKERKALERSLEVDNVCRFVRVNVGGDHLGKLEMWACLRRRG